MTSEQPRKLTYISMFSGIEAASVAWEPLHFEPLAFAEVDPFPSAILKKHYPHVPNLGDITTVDWSEYHGKVDIVVGGSPCQSFSVAGLRKGLDDPRGNLMLEYLRACDQIKPEWIIWENVPGVLSADGGRAFGAFLGALEELGYHAAWRVLDAQFFGVAQRRRRIFVVAHASDWRCAASVLFECKSLFGDYSSSREARAGSTAAAQTCFGEASSAGRIKEAIAFLSGNSAQSRSLGEAEGVTPTIRTSAVPAVCCEEKKSFNVYSIAGNIIGRTPKNGGNGNGYQTEEEPMYTLTAADCHAVCQAAFKSESSCLNPWETQSGRVFTENGIFPSLVGGGNGTRGYAGGCVLDRTTRGKKSMLILNDHGGARMDISHDVVPTLRTNANGDESIIMGSGQPNAAITEGLCPTQTARQHKDPPILKEGEVGTLQASGGCIGGGSETLVAECALAKEPKEQTESDQQAFLESSFGVRRLTPIECERLQGFPDNWTRIEWNGKPEEQCPNGRRYKAIGNSMAVPVMRWIGEGVLTVAENQINEYTK